jgi:two-component system CheB/CheR fusion protein
VSDDGAVVFMHGELRPYLRFPEGERPRLDLTSLVTQELETRTRSALFKCRRDGVTVVALSSPDSARAGRVRITASPAPEIGRGAVILTFEDVATDADEKPASGGGPSDESAIRELEAELDATRGNLKKTVEELEDSYEKLRTSNEEAMSMNEELQSANEELEATTEELSSLNEELTTLNAQLREKVEQLEQAHDDLSNFFASAKVATVFLDEQLTIKRFTPAAAELLGLVPGDHGRSIAGVSRDLLRNGLEREARTVLEHQSVQSRELNAGERWIMRQVLPYRTEAKRIEGVVVTFMDVTALKSATERLAMRERQQAVIARTGLFALRGTHLQAFMDHVVREVQQTLQTDFCKILELQPGGTRLLLRAGVGWREGIVGNGVVPSGADSQAGYTLTSAEPIIVEDLFTEKRFSGPAVLTDHGVVSGMSCVIRDGDQVYGVLGAHTDRPRAFSTEDASFLQAIASVIGSAVGRHRTRIRLAIERGVAQALAESGTPDAAFTKVLECFAKEFPISVGEIWWPTRDRRLERALFYVSPPSAKERFGKEFGECEFESGEQLVGRVFEEGKAVWCTDVADPDTFMRREVAANLGLVAGFGFPIRAGRDVLGVVAIFSQDRLSADESLLNTLEALGRSMGEFMARWDVESRAKRLAAITASSHDAIISYDFDGKVTEWLVGAEQLFGYSAAEMVGNSIDTIILEERRAEMRNIMARIRNGEVVDPYEATRVRKDGTVLDISIRSSPVFDAEGNLVGISSSDRDITKQKDVERRLVMADRQKDEFLAMLGHELRNPLATIRSAAELLKLSPGNPDRLARTQAVLERQSAHMAKLLDGLLDVSRIIRGTIHLDRETIDLATICRDVCSDVIERIPGRNLDIRTLLPPGPVWLNADPVRVAQIVDNLLTNAVKYTPDGGSITVTLSRANGTAVLSIRDTGVGIARDLLPDIFEVFRQAKQSLDRSHGGLGLGLALVKSLAELHDGTVEALSEGPDRGAEFIVRLPMTARPVAARDSIGTSTTGPLSVLLIEDNEESAELLREVLRLSGHTVWIASRGREGIAMARKLRPDLVLCDLGLPDGMTGFDVARELRRHTESRSLKLVALSGYGRPEDKDRSEEAGFDAHLTKPVDVKTIGRVVGELVGR